MRCILILFFFWNALYGQITFPERFGKTFISRLQENDSLVYYQCHVEEFTPQLNSASGQTITTAPEKYSLTEKFIIRRVNNKYEVKHFVSSYINLPNRRFSGQKIREKRYWNYKFLKSAELTEKSVLLLAALELKGQEPTEYDFAITKHTTNQIIIKNKKDFRQLVINGTYLISNIIAENLPQKQ